MWASLFLETSDVTAAYGPLLLPAALAGVAVYLLLPRARPYPAPLGAAVAGLALVAAGALLIRVEGVIVETVLFYTFAGLAVVFGGLMITQRNPVHAALSFAMVVLSTCGLFLLQAAPFLMAGTIIIYAGAIVVTFLFVIMLAQQSGLSSADQRSREPFLASVAAFVLLGALVCVLHNSYSGFDRAFDPYLDKAERAAQAGTVKGWQEILGKDDAFFKEFHGLVTRPRDAASNKPQDPGAEARVDLVAALDQAREQWNRVRPPDDGPPREPTPDAIKEFKNRLRTVYERAVALRQGQGTLQPNPDLPISQYSVPLGPDGKPTRALPAANVAGLGKTLFTDYLLAVELAGTLLLVATIGAIAIAGRRPEGLR
jgi:NADH:ubiquinone oxidoreductase subunit 6 (subunit J)